MRHNPDESSRPPCPVSLPFSSPGQLREASPKQTNINTRMRRIYNLYYTVFPWFLARMCDCVYICFCVFTCVCVFLCMYVITLTENGKVYRQTKAKIAEAYCPSPFFASHKKRKAAESFFSGQVPLQVRQPVPPLWRLLPRLRKWEGGDTLLSYEVPSSPSTRTFYISKSKRTEVSTSCYVTLNIVCIVKYHGDKWET